MRFVRVNGHGSDADRFGNTVYFVSGDLLVVIGETNHGLIVFAKNASILLLDPLWLLFGSMSEISL